MKAVETVGQKFAKKIAKYKQPSVLDGTLDNFKNLLQSGIPVEASVVEHLKGACKAGATHNMLILASLYKSGIVVEKSLEEAVKYYTLAANSGDSVAKTKLGKHYFAVGEKYRTGSGVEKNETIAQAYYKLARDQGYQAQDGVEKEATPKKSVVEPSVSQQKSVVEQSVSQPGTTTGTPTGTPTPVTPTTPPNITRQATPITIPPADTTPESPEELDKLYQKAKKYYSERNLKKAISYFTLAAKDGHTEALYHLGLCYEKGEGVKKDLDVAKKHLLQATSKGHIKALNALGRCHEGSAEAFKFYKQAAEKGDSDGMVAVALCYYEGKGVAMDRKKAYEYHEMATKQGNDEAKYLIGDCYKNLAYAGDTTYQFLYGSCCFYNREFDEAKTYLQLAANNGHVEAMYYLGQYYDVRNMQGLATIWFLKAANKGHVDAYSALGCCYEKGDAELAIKYYKEAADRGSSLGMANLALCYYMGKGVAMDKVKAYEYYTKASELGNDSAKQILPGCYKALADNNDAEKQYLYGKYCYTNNNLGDAIKYLAMSAKNGYVKAMYDLGKYYEEDANNNRSLAVHWFVKAGNDKNALFSLGEYNEAENKLLAIEYFYKAALQNHKGAFEKLEGFIYETLVKSDTYMGLSQKRQSLFSTSLAIVTHLKLPSIKYGWVAFFEKHLPKTKIAVLELEEGTESLMSYLPSSLKTLAMRKNNLGDVKIKTVAEALPSTLQELCLNSNNIGIEGLKELVSHLPKMLQRLDLSDNSIKGAGTKLLAGHLHPPLQSLNLKNNAIGDEGAKALTGYLPKSLESLNISSNGIGDEGIKTLALRLPKNLQELDLEANNIGDEGAKALAERLPAGLLSLQLSRNQIGNAGVKVVDESAPSWMPSLKIEGNRVAGVALKKHSSGSRRFRRTTNKKRLNLSGTIPPNKS